jgi:hypothetical protein
MSNKLIFLLHVLGCDLLHPNTYSRLHAYHISLHPVLIHVLGCEYIAYTTLLALPLLHIMLHTQPSWYIG